MAAATGLFQNDRTSRVAGFLGHLKRCSVLSREEPHYGQASLVSSLTLLISLLRCLEYPLSSCANVDFVPLGRFASSVETSVGAADRTFFGRYSSIVLLTDLVLELISPLFLTISCHLH